MEHRDVVSAGNSARARAIAKYKRVIHQIHEIEEWHCVSHIALDMVAEFVGDSSCIESCTDAIEVLYDYAECIAIEHGLRVSA
jgi:hypothetical protein